MELQQPGLRREFWGTRGKSVVTQVQPGALSFGAGFSGKPFLSWRSPVPCRVLPGRCPLVQLLPACWKGGLGLWVIPGLGEGAGATVRLREPLLCWQPAAESTVPSPVGREGRSSRQPLGQRFSLLTWSLLALADWGDPSLGRPRCPVVWTAAEMSRFLIHLVFPLLQRRG